MSLSKEILNPSHATLGRNSLLIFICININLLMKQSTMYHDSLVPLPSRSDNVDTSNLTTSFFSPCGFI